MTFGVYLEKCIREKNISISRLTKVTGINRGGLYSVFKGERSLKEDKLFALFENVGFSLKEEQTLTELYFSDVFGQSDFNKIKQMIHLINNLELPSKEHKEFINTFSKKFSLTGKEEILSALKYILKEIGNSKVITNYSYEDERIDHLFYSFVKNGNKEQLIHILSFSEKSSGLHNINTVFSSLKYMYLNCFPVYKYENKSEQIYPYFAVTDKYALLFNDNDGIFIDEPIVINRVLGKVETMVSQCTGLGMATDDVMFIKDMYAKGLSKTEDNFNELITYCGYPCVAPFADYDLMYSITRDELPEKELLVHIAYDHYQSLYKNADFTFFYSLNGLKRFAETGNVCEIPETYVTNLSIKYRLQVLNQIIEAVKDEKIYLVNDEKFNIPENIEIEDYFSKVIISAFDCNKDNFFSCNKFLSTLNDSDIIHTFKILKEYLIRARMVYPKQYAEIYIKNIIVKLENMDIE